MTCRGGEIRLLRRGCANPEGCRRGVATGRFSGEHMDIVSGRCARGCANPEVGRRGVATGRFSREHTNIVSGCCARGVPIQRAVEASGDRLIFIHEVYAACFNPTKHHVNGRGVATGLFSREHMDIISGCCARGSANPEGG